MAPLALPRLGLPYPPLGPDPLRRVKVPRDVTELIDRGPEAEPESGGMTRDGVEFIWRGVERLFRSGVHPAIQLCVRREGAVVLNRAIGWSRGAGCEESGARVPVSVGTPFCIFSASKAVTATVVHLLDERGALHVDDRVAEYLPEFDAPGKDAITIEHVLSHRAGIPNLPREAMDLDRLGDPAFISEVLAASKPLTRPGKLLAYHAVSGGFVLGKVVEAATGRSIRQVLADEVLDPLGFRWGNYGVAPEDVPQVGRSVVTGPPAFPPISTLLTRALGVPPDAVTRMSNDPRFLTGVIPAANVVSTGEELSRFFEVLRRGGELDGTQVMEARTVRRAVVERSYRELDLSLGAPMRHSSGFMLGAKVISLYGPDTDLAFGHLGFTNVLGWADPERGLAVGLITSGKPTAYLELKDLYGLTTRIGRAAPKVLAPAIGVRSLAPR